MKTAVVTGASSGLGLEIAQALKPYYVVLNWSLETGVDVSDERSVIATVCAAQASFHKIDVLVNCAGVNHIEWIGSTKIEDWDKVLNTNARGILTTVKQCLPLLADSTICNIISNASHVPMTASIAYNASKAAAAMMTRQMARELWRSHRITVFGVSPNMLEGTLMTQKTMREVPALRGWTAAEYNKKQMEATATGHLTPPSAVAEFIGWLLSSKERHMYLAGSILEYGA